jgi:hypothetical protein
VFLLGFLYNSKRYKIGRCIITEFSSVPGGIELPRIQIQRQENPWTPEAQAKFAAKREAAKTALDDYVNRCITNNLVHSVHNSTVQSFLGCRRRWDLATRQMYYPLVTPKPLEFGSAFHKGMEKLYDPLTWDDKEVALGLAKQAFVEECKAQFSKYLKLNKGNIDPSMRAEYNSRILLGISMLNYYGKYVSPETDRNFTPVKVEIPFEVPIRSPRDEYMFCKCEQCYKRWVASDLAKETIAKCTAEKLHDCDPEDHFQTMGLPVTYGGRIDCLVQDTFGRYWVYDWKTAAQLSGTKARSTEFMLLDTQITSYCWALWTLGFPIAGFVYAEIKKAVPEEPEPMKNQRLGRWYSVSKQMSTTAEIYKKTVEEGDPGGYAAGLYDDFIEYLKSDEGPRFSVRHEVHRNEAELRNAGINIWQIASEMVNPDLRVYPSPGRFACSFCAYQEPCLGMNRGEDYQYTLNTLFEKRTRHYFEERPSSTDSRGGE